MIQLGSNYISRDKRMKAVPLNIKDDEVHFQLIANKSSVLYQRWNVQQFEQSFCEAKSSKVVH